MAYYIRELLYRQYHYAVFLFPEQYYMEAKPFISFLTVPGMIDRIAIESETVPVEQICLKRRRNSVFSAARSANQYGIQKGKSRMRYLWKKRSLLFALVIAMFMSLGAGNDAFAEDEEEEEPELSVYQQMQIKLIESKLDELLQTDDQNTWYYCIMDLDRNGQIEFFAADQHPMDRSTNLKVWEVNSETTDMTECAVEIQPDESFPDIISNSADTFYDRDKDRWSYLFYDNVVLSPVEVYTVRCSVSMRNSVIGYEAYAVEHSELVDSYRYVSHMDTDGNPISADQYNAAGASAFNEAERSTTNFDWFSAEEARTPERLSNSYKVFANMRPAPVRSPIVPPPVMQHDELAPLQGTAGEMDAVYMMITENPTSEKKKVGQSLSFVTSANVYDSAYWTFVSPQGDEYDLDYFAAHFVNSYIDGYYEPTLTIQNLDPYMDGWGAYCTYSFKGQTAVTSTAWMTIKPA